MLRKQISNAQCTAFFITTNGTEIRKIFDCINAECRRLNIRLPDRPDGTPGDVLKVSGSLLRKATETATKDHGPDIRAGVASALMHSEETAKRYYHVDSAADAREQQRALKVVETSTAIEEHIMAK